MTFGAWLQDQLDQRGWKQTDLARACGLSKQQINAVVRGNRTPSNTMLKTLAHALHLPDVDLFRAAGILDAPPCDDAFALAHRIDMLDDHSRKIVIELIDALTRLQTS